MQTGHAVCPLYGECGSGRLARANSLRWLLPILCRRGEVDRRQIGHIEVMAEETRFEVAAAAA